MRSRTFLLLFILIADTFALPLIAEAAIPFFGPIIPDAWNRCPASWGGLITVVNNLIQLLLTLVIVFVAPIMIAYAGFLYVINPINPDGKSKAKSLLLNVVIGMVIALGAWLIVDAVLAALTNNGQPFGQNWKTLINSGGLDPCLRLPDSFAPVRGVAPQGATAGAAYGLPTNANCSPATIQQAAQAGGCGLTSAQANTLSCIAVAESSCGTNTRTATTPDGKSTTASGMFQIVLGLHDLNLPVCSQVVGHQGNLNCTTAFSGGKPKSGMEDLAAKCQAAAANTECNAAAAACIVQKNRGSFSAWTADSRSSAQKNCISQYAGG